MGVEERQLLSPFGANQRRAGNEITDVTTKRFLVFNSAVSAVQEPSSQKTVRFPLEPVRKYFELE